MARATNYSTADDDVRALLVKVTDSIRSDTQVVYWIDKADDYIDSVLGRLYTVPFATTPPLVKHISASLAAHYTLKSIKIETTEEQNNWINLYKEEALEMLMQLLQGKILLLDSTGSEILPSKQRGIISSTLDYQPIFNEGSATEWLLDENKQQDEMDNY